MAVGGSVILCVCVCVLHVLMVPLCVVQALMVHKSSHEQMESRKQKFLEEKEQLEKKNNSLRTDFDLERKRRQELVAKTTELESE